MKETSLSDDERATRPVPQPIDALQHLVQTPAGRAQMLERIDGFIAYTGATRENIEEARRLIRDGYVPILYANHQSHADKLVLSGITQSLVRHDTDGQVSGFLVPVAATIESGAQGAYIQRLMSLFEPLYLDRGYGPDVPFITDNDRQARGVEGSNTESVKRLMDAPRDKHGLVIFPEATLKGGRRGDDGAVNGIQEVTPVTGGGLIGYPKFWLRRRLGEAVFIPIGISGSYRIYPPDSGRNEISPTVIAGILEGGRAEAMVAISAGKPFTYAELRDEVEEEPDPKQKKHLDLMMAKVAELLPTAEKGYY
jgi:1-acyl-sn-glycerol-3-phosphate acyltransferase